MDRGQTQRYAELPALPLRTCSTSDGPPRLDAALTVAKRDEQRCTERHADKHDRTVAHVSRPPATKVSKSSNWGTLLPSRRCCFCLIAEARLVVVRLLGALLPVVRSRRAADLDAGARI